jgi:hypothetical protein
MKAMSGVVIAMALASGCSAMAPPPMMMMMASTRPLPESTTTAMVVVGGGFELFGTNGLGLAVRVERQVGDNVAAGAQLGGGRGREGRYKNEKDASSVGGGVRPVHWLGELRAYARGASTGDNDWAAVLGSVGVTVMETGMIAGTLALQGEVSYPNDDVIPALGLGIARSQVLRRGQPFGEGPEAPKSTTWFGVNLGGLVPVKDGKGAVVFDLGFTKGNGAHVIHAAAGGAVYDVPGN